MVVGAKIKPNNMLCSGDAYSYGRSIISPRHGMGDVNVKEEQERKEEQGRSAIRCIMGESCITEPLHSQNCQATKRLSKKTYTNDEHEEHHPLSTAPRAKYMRHQHPRTIQARKGTRCLDTQPRLRRGRTLGQLHRLSRKPSCRDLP